MPRQPRPAKPLDRESLDRLALRYVERFATTRAKLARYLDNKIRQRGWEGPPADTLAIAERMAALGYVDDAAFSTARAGALTRRGLGERRVRADLRAAGIEDEQIDAAAEEVTPNATAAALALARRRRFGPYARETPDPATREKQLATMLRAGHSLTLSRRVLALAPGTDPTEADL
jgi:regulatory protein